MCIGDDWAGGHFVICVFCVLEWPCLFSEYLINICWWAKHFSPHKDGFFICRRLNNPLLSSLHAKHFYTICVYFFSLCYSVENRSFFWIILVVTFYGTNPSLNLGLKGATYFILNSVLLQMNLETPKWNTDHCLVDFCSSHSQKITGFVYGLREEVFCSLQHGSWEIQSSIGKSNSLFYFVSLSYSTTISQLQVIWIWDIQTSYSTWNPPNTQTLQLSFFILCQHCTLFSPSLAKLSHLLRSPQASLVEESFVWPPSLPHLDPGSSPTRT